METNYYSSEGLLRGMGQSGSGPMVSPAPTAIATTAAGVSSLMYVASLASTAALAYHGYKRNNSVGWAVAWGILGGLVWPIGLTVAFVQGFGKPRVRKNRMRKNRRRHRRAR